jgi:hypothetical protein
MLNQPELTAKALEILRNTDTFQWYFIPLLAFGDRCRPVTLL